MPGYTKSHTYSSTFEPNPFLLKKSVPSSTQPEAVKSEASPAQLLAKFLEAHRALENYK